LKKSKAALVAVAFALSLFSAGAAKANAWKIEPLSNQVSVIQQASELQGTDRREFICLSLAIYHESKSQPLAGMRAVGHVVLNRKKKGAWGRTLCSVVFADNQFTWSRRPVMAIMPRETKNWIQSQEVAWSILRGDPDLTNGALYFYNIKTDRPSWRFKGVQTFVLGPHVFRKF
jgi:spore germination cell wall hydrolase CwlJ-like protein